MIDVLPSAPQNLSPTPISQNQTTAPVSQETGKTSETSRPLRILEKLSTEESESVRRDPAILELLKIFKGEIGMITKDAPTQTESPAEEITTNRPAAAVETHVDTDDEEEFA